MRLWSGRGVLGLSPVPIPNRSVRFPIGLTGAAPTVIAALAGLTWIFWGDHAGAAVLGPTGILAVGAFVMVAEIRARAASRAARLYQRLADHSTDMIVSFDPETQKRSYVSPSCRQLYGYEPDEAMRMAATEIIHPDDFPNVRAALNQINGSGQGVVTYRGRRKDGIYIWVEASLTAFRNPTTAATEIVSVIRDISDRVRAESALRDAKRQAEAANHAKSEFLSTVSHELRTPLNAVIGFSEIMERELLGPIGNEKYRSYIVDIQRSGKLLLNVINDILDLSKAEAGKWELTEDVFDVEQTLRAVLRLLKPRLDEADLSAAISLPTSLPLLRADERKTQQVFFNLLSNAVKFTPPGGRIDVVGQHDHANGITIRVRDTGIGIDPEKLECVFEPFMQIDSALSRKHSGTGLGLSVVRAIMEHHKGSVELKSDVGNGTEAILVFPAERVLEADESVRVSAHGVVRS